MTESVLIVDALSAGHGKRTSSRDSIGCGPRAIAGVFELHSVQCRIIRAEDFVRKPRMKDFDHLAISAMTMDVPIVNQLVRKWSNVRKRGRTLLGGPIANDHSIVKQIKPDVMIIGEGESTLNELLSLNFLSEDIELDLIPGIGFLDSDGVRITERRAFLTSQEMSDQFIPSTVRVTDYQGYQASRIYVEVTRGCSNFKRTRLPLPDGRECSDCSNCDSPNFGDRVNCPEDIPPGCGFCSVPGTWGAPRSRSVKAIVNEVEELLTLGARRIVLESPDFLDFQRSETLLTDPCSPPANTTNIRTLLETITALPWFQEDQAHLSIENIKACLFSEHVAQLLSEILPSTSPNIGLETGSFQHAESIGKCGSPQDVLRAVKLAKEYGMSPYVYFIFGLPGETSETVEESVKLMRSVSQSGAERIILYGFRALPGSAFQDFPEPKRDYLLGQKMQEEAQRINRRKKDEYIGKELRAVASEPSWAKKEYTMFYPLGEGPLMTVRGEYSPGTLLTVRVVSVLSPGLLEAKAIKRD